MVGKQVEVKVWDRDRICLQMLAGGQKHLLWDSTALLSLFALGLPWNSIHPHPPLILFLLLLETGNRTLFAPFPSNNPEKLVKA